MNSKRLASNNQQGHTRGGSIQFSLGRVGATPGALDLLDRTGTNAAAFLARHQRGDFGTVVDAEDVRANMDAAINGSRILSAYVLTGERLWIITEADRCATTLLLPEEY